VTAGVIRHLLLHNKKLSFAAIVLSIVMGAFSQPKNQQIKRKDDEKNNALQNNGCAIMDTIWLYARLQRQCRLRCGTRPVR
jgi:hypothetical protein